MPGKAFAGAGAAPRKDNIMTLPIPFDFTVTEDRRGINFEGVEAGHPDPEGALNLHLRVARDHLVLSVWPVKGGNGRNF